ncbi:spermidine/putrescine ABC transporter permease PotC [Aphanothece hegewaldii CCALA 016]|uniref:Spermidine/putrescine ABC transporter permease PotC n=1 Tax=Aphanothece hegewaldii CCALA 016 TaxID=2107694 RepID=A0A2T1M3N6_9CHRO|nr:ABC transporter permease [Aphanothece hegewaldii]PSF39432.1 spermidine/putrescine ABC transporter permease PotC [Aphanothece hegewaldii CCALA 016]
MFRKIKLDLLIRKFGKYGLWFNTIFGLIFLYLPIFILIIYSFNASRFNSVWRGFTLDWYQSLLSGITDKNAQITDDMVWSALQNSLIVAVISTFFSTLLGTMLALALERFQIRGKSWLEGLLILPIIIPEITMGISLLVFFSLLFKLIETFTGIRLVLGLPTVIIGHIAFSLSFVAIIVRGRIAELEPFIEEAAWDLGANEWQTLRLIILPLITPSIISAALLAFTLSLDDFVITFFTTGVGATTLPLFVYGMIRFSVSPIINAISTLMLITSLLLVISSLILSKESSNRLF